MIATTGIAQWQVAARQPGNWRTAERYAPAGWPISFAMPNAVDEWKRSDEPTDSAAERIRRMLWSVPQFTKLTFHGYQSGQPTTRVQVGYIDSADQSQIERTKRELGIDDRGNAQPLNVGAFTGEITTAHNPATRISTAICAGHIAPGRTIVVSVASSNPPPFVAAVARWICGTVRATE